MAFVQQQTAADSSTEMILALVRKVASQFKIDAQKAYGVVTALIGSKDEETALTRKAAKLYGEEIDAITQALVVADNQRRLVCAYAILVYRVSEDFTIEELMELDPQLIQAVFELYEKEEARVVVDVQQGSDKDATSLASEVEELEKK